MKTLQTGDRAPSFAAKDESGNTISSTSYIGKKWIVFFYPKANTPGCTAEACSLRDHYAQLQAKGYAILGVSADPEKQQRHFKDKYQFPFPLIADEDKNVIQAFGVWGPKKFMGKTYNGIHRTTFIIDENGLVQRVISDVNTKNHAAQILED